MAKDLTGMVFGHLTVVGSAKRMGRYFASRCVCSCGAEKVVMNHNLLSGRTASCGCWKGEETSRRVKKNPPRLKHGGKSRNSDNPKRLTYGSWCDMLRRCRKGNAYSLRGISVCDRWSDPDTGFLAFVEDVGLRPSKAHSIDRINGGNYEPGNCRWVTRSQQNQNVGLKKSNTTGYKGIKEEHVGRWCADIRNNGKRIRLGVYETKEEAALAYDVASERLHGDYGVRNGVSGLPSAVSKRIFARVLSVLEKETMNHHAS